MENSRYRDKENAGGQQTKEKNNKSGFPSMLSPFPKNGTSFKRRMDLHTHKQTRHQTEKRGKWRSEQSGGRKKRQPRTVFPHSPPLPFRACFRRHAKRKRAKKKNANNLGRKKKKGYTNFTAFFFSFFFLYRRTRGAVSLVSLLTTPVLFSLVRVPSASIFVGYAASRRVSPRPRYNAPLKKRDEPKAPHVCARVRAALILA